MSRPPRDDPKAVGVATRAMIDRAIASTSTDRELTRYARALLATIYLTSTYGRLSDTVFLAQLSDVAKIADDEMLKNTKEQVHTLLERGVISYEASTRPHQPSWVSIEPGRQSTSNRPLMRALSDPPPDENNRSVLEGGSLESGIRGRSDPPSEAACAVCDERGALLGFFGGQWWCPRHLADYQRRDVA